MQQLLVNIEHSLRHNLTDPYPEIPGNLGLPYIGSTLDFARDINGLIVKCWKKYGDVFKLRVLGENVIGLAGADANKLVLQEEQDAFLSKEAWNFIIGDLFKDAIMLSDGEQHSRYRRIMQTAFHKQPMVGYLEVIEQEVQEYLDHEIPIKKGKLITYPAMVRLTMKIAGRLFFGVEFSEKHLDAIMEVTIASMSPIHLDIPYTTYGKGMEARRMLAKYYASHIKKTENIPATTCSVRCALPKAKMARCSAMKRSSTK
jgi:retinoid hydroxylase